MTTRQRSSSKPQGKDEAKVDDAPPQEPVTDATDATVDETPTDPRPAASEATSGQNDSTAKRGEQVEESSGTRYLNVSGGPLTYSRNGEIVDADAWTPPVNLDELGQRQRRNRFLLPKSEL